MKRKDRVLLAVAFFFLVVLCFTQSGCFQKKMEVLKPQRFDSNDQAGSVHIALISRAHWDEYKDDLQPTFELKEADALNTVVPTTSAMEEKFLDALQAGLKIATPTTSETKTRTTTTKTDQPTISESEKTKERKPGDLSGVAYEKSIAEGRKAGELPPAKSVLENPIGVDPMMKYWAATALYQEVKVLNKYIKHAAIEDVYEPYVARMQVSLMPSARYEPYDAYVTFSFFGSPDVISQSNTVKISNRVASSSFGGTTLETTLISNTPGNFVLKSLESVDIMGDNVAEIKPSVKKEKASKDIKLDYLKRMITSPPPPFSYNEINFGNIVKGKHIQAIYKFKNNSLSKLKIKKIDRGSGFITCKIKDDKWEYAPKEEGVIQVNFDSTYAQIEEEVYGKIVEYEINVKVLYEGKSSEEVQNEVVPKIVLPNEIDYILKLNGTIIKSERNVKIIPLLVTDNIESMIHSRSTDRLRKYAMALSFMFKGVSGNLDLQKYSEDLQTLLGSDLNSLLTVARVSDNTLRVRLGAMHQGGIQYSMVPRNHNITLLVLVPKGVRNVRVATKSTMVDAISGKSLRSRTWSEIDKKLDTVLQGFPNIPDNYPYISEGRVFLKGLLKYVQANRWSEYENKFALLLKANTDAQRAANHIRRVLRNYKEQLWAEIAELMVGSLYSSLSFQVPRVPKYDPTLPDKQTFLAFDDRKANTSIILRHGKDLKSERLYPVLYVKPLTGTQAKPEEPDPDLGEVGNSGYYSLVAQSVETKDKGKTLIMLFPSIVAWQIINEVPQTKPDDIRLGIRLYDKDRNEIETQSYSGTFVSKIVPKEKQVPG
ncbi:MAG: DUF1573 domain-containing protein, partial [Deltaproteobacteria bacterium]|nr:DUF1573 domain-containing protein [Deltaproteobacteria bacterium]